MIDYLTAHWQGEHSLARSFWINSLTGLAVCGPVVALTTDYARRGSIEDGGATLQTLVMIWLAMLAVLTWEAVGCWRAATEHMAQTGSLATPLLVKALVSVLALVIGVEIADAMMALGEMYVMTRMAREASETPPATPTEQAAVPPPPIVDRQQPPKTLHRTPDGSDPVVAANHPAFSRISRDEIKLTGKIEFGMETPFNTIAYSDPDLTTIRLESPGGSVAASMAILSSILELRRNTQVFSYCVSACTFIFAAGDMRIASPNARFGFHKFSSPVATQEQLDAYERVIREQLINRRWLAPDFLDQVFRVPAAKVWYPSLRELVEANYVTHILEDGTPVPAHSYCQRHRC